ncbi:MAG TPA: GNAT family N-acetyltransferase [Kofleriaceae bacterium]|nr:GNAT family N-acetyltransferase [Kofleriaceae bacterium]
MRIRAIRSGDEAGAARMRHALWPSGSEAEHQAEILAYLAVPADMVMLVAERADGALCGFAEASLRSHAEACDPSRPVAFLEGWYVAPDQRRRGVGTALVTAVEAWGLAAGCRELASDAELDNDVGQRAHVALGFEEVERAVQFRKSIGTPGAAAGMAPGAADMARPAKPSPRVGRVARGSLRAAIPADLPDELVTVLAGAGGVRVERIVSRGHASPPGFWYQQDEDELVLVVSGSARLEVEGAGEVALGEGDWIDIGHHVRHRVSWTAPDRDTIWLAVYWRPAPGPS